METLSSSPARASPVKLEQLIAEQLRQVLNTGIDVIDDVEQELHALAEKHPIWAAISAVALSAALKSLSDAGWSKLIMTTPAQEADHSAAHSIIDVGICS